MGNSHSISFAISLIDDEFLGAIMRAYMQKLVHLSYQRI